MNDSGRVCRIITKNLAKNILKLTPRARWTTTTDEKDLKNLSNEPIKVLGKLVTTVTYNEWTCDKASLTVVDDGHEDIIRRDLFNSLGLEIRQQQQKQPKSRKCVNNIDNSTCVAISRTGFKISFIRDPLFWVKVSSKELSKAPKRSSPPE